MKLMDDDGELIGTFASDVALLAIASDGSMSAVFPKGNPDDVVPTHVKIVGALTLFLAEADNVKQVLRCLPQRRDSNHRHN